jgi:hypothetical protein
MPRLGSRDGSLPSPPGSPVAATATACFSAASWSSISRTASAMTRNRTPAASMLATSSRSCSRPAVGSRRRGGRPADHVLIPRLDMGTSLAIRAVRLQRVDALDPCEGRRLDDWAHVPAELAEDSEQPRQTDAAPRGDCFCGRVLTSLDPGRVDAQSLDSAESSSDGRSGGLLSCSPELKYGPQARRTD